MLSVARYNPDYFSAQLFKYLKRHSSLIFKKNHSLLHSFSIIIMCTNNNIRLVLHNWMIWIHMWSHLNKLSNNIQYINAIYTTRVKCSLIYRVPTHKTFCFYTEQKIIITNLLSYILENQNDSNYTPHFRWILNGMFMMCVTHNKIHLNIIVILRVNAAHIWENSMKINISRNNHKLVNIWLDLNGRNKSVLIVKEISYTNTILITINLWLTPSGNFKK